MWDEWKGIGNYGSKMSVCGYNQVYFGSDEVFLVRSKVMTRCVYLTTLEDLRSNMEAPFLRIEGSGKS